NECSWCRKHQFSYTGHNYKNCRKLKEEKTPVPGNANVAARAPSPDHSDSDYGVALITSSSIRRNRTQEVWHLDTCSSHHITADKSLLLDPEPYVIGIKVGSGTVMKSSHRGTVKLVLGV